VAHPAKNLKIIPSRIAPARPPRSLRILAGGAPEKSAAAVAPVGPTWLFAVGSRLGLNIAANTELAIAEMKEMSDAHTKALVSEFRDSEKAIKQAIKDFDHGLPNPAARLARLDGLKTEIDRSIEAAVTRQKSLIPGHSEQALKHGVSSGVDDLVQQGRGSWGGLNAAQVAQAASGAMSVVDATALSFLTAYRMELAGAVGDDLKGRIKKSLSAAIVQGTPLYEVTRQLGHVVTDPEKFRHAGGKIFPSAANRLQLIVETENSRAHNRGRVAFYTDAGLSTFRWYTAKDERVCRICGPKHNRVYKTEDLPDLPLHPACRCTVVAEEATALKQPEDYGVEVEKTPAKKLPTRLDTEAKEWPGKKGVHYRTDAATDSEKRAVRQYASMTTTECRRAGVPIEQLSGGRGGVGGFEFLCKRRSEMGFKGVYRHSTKRIVVPVLDDAGKLLPLDQVSITAVEELAHHLTVKKKWFKLEKKRWKTSAEMEPILEKALLSPPTGAKMLDDWKVVKNMPVETQQFEIAAKMIRQSARRSKAVEKVYPDLWTKIQEIIEK